MVATLDPWGLVDTFFSVLDLITALRGRMWGSAGIMLFGSYLFLSLQWKSRIFMIWNLAVNFWMGMRLSIFYVIISWSTVSSSARVRVDFVVPQVQLSRICDLGSLRYFTMNLDPYRFTCLFWFVCRATFKRRTFEVFTKGQKRDKNNDGASGPACFDYGVEHGYRLII